MSASFHWSKGPRTNLKSKIKVFQLKWLLFWLIIFLFYNKVFKFQFLCLFDFWLGFLFLWWWNLNLFNVFLDRHSRMFLLFSSIQRYSLWLGLLSLFVNGSFCPTYRFRNTHPCATALHFPLFLVPNVIIFIFIVEVLIWISVNCLLLALWWNSNGLRIVIVK